MKDLYMKYLIIAAASLLVVAIVILGIFVPAEKKKMAPYVEEGKEPVTEAASLNPGQASTAQPAAPTTPATSAVPGASTDAAAETGSTETTEQPTETKVQDPERVYDLSSPALDEYLGASGVVKWLEDHCNDYYLKTEFLIGSYAFDDPEKLLRPYGEFGEEGRMNCTGFVSHVMKSCGADLSPLTAQGQWGGYANAVSYWKLANAGDVGYYTFDSVDELLASGKARKGDVLYLEPDWSAENTDCHIGFFWGDNSADNKFWNSDLRGNAITEITMIDPIQKIYLFPLSGK